MTVNDRTDICLDRTSFFLDMIAHLSSSLEQVIGLDDAEGYFSLVGAAIGTDLSAQYRTNLGHDDLSIGEIAKVLVDLKQRIDGGFRVESVDDDKIVLVNTRCPFGEKAVGRTSLCMMTSNVFGTIAADAAGCATVDIQQSIAAGHGGCRVVVHLNTVSAPGNQYFAKQEP